MWEPIVNAEQMPELPPATCKLFVQFINCANRSVLHPLDWRRFYRFIRFCHSRRVKLSRDCLRDLLIRGHFSKQKAADLAEIYLHGRRLLSA